MLLLLVRFHRLPFLSFLGGLFRHFRVLSQDLVHVEALLRDFVKISLHALLAVAEDHDLFGLAEELQLMRDKNDALVRQHALNRLIEDSVCHSWVHR